jgi:hypothetical protein
MLISCTLRDGIVYVPTVAKTEAGFYMNREPVAAVPAADTTALQRALRDAMRKGNATIPTPKRTEYPPPVLPKYAGLKSWSEFMQGASEWKILERNGNYKIVPYCEDPEGSGSWLENSAHKIEFPPGSTIDDVIDRMIAILQET